MTAVDPRLAYALTDPMATWPLAPLWLVAEGLDRLEQAGQLHGPHELMYLRACALLAQRWGLTWLLLDPTAHYPDGPTLLQVLREAHDDQTGM